jgi:hypothetical protein
VRQCLLHTVMHHRVLLGVNTLLTATHASAASTAGTWCDKCALGRPVIMCVLGLLHVPHCRAPSQESGMLSILQHNLCIAGLSLVTGELRCCAQGNYLIRVATASYYTALLSTTGTRRRLGLTPAASLGRCCSSRTPTAHCTFHGSCACMPGFLVRCPGKWDCLLTLHVSSCRL